MTMYAVSASIRTHAGDWHGSRQVPVFYLDGEVQGITDERHAEAVARTVLNPVQRIEFSDIDVKAYAIPAAENSGPVTHLVRRASGYVAGWHRSGTDAARCAIECDREVPGDPAHVEALEGDSAWDGVLGVAGEFTPGQRDRAREVMGRVLDEMGMGYTLAAMTGPYADILRIALTDSRLAAQH
jgi:hypothetical protein